jgi:carbamate kinase
VSAPVTEKRVVVALGGNASYPPTIRGLAEEQFALMAEACEHLVKIIEAGYQLVLTHGNGPVVGNILFRMARTARELPPMPMDVCVAHSQGGMGYMLQQSLANTLRAHGMAMTASAVVTQVEVDPHDPAFAHPTKPVGRFFSQSEAERIAAETGWEFTEDAGRGYRRVVASPEPRKILDLAAIEALLAAGVVPIAAGGGGIPVVRTGDGAYHGVAAVIDKDFTSAMLAAHLKAQTLLMLTGVDRVAVDWGKPAQRYLDGMTAAEAQRHYDDGQFPAGSMGPKIRAALLYLAASGGEVVITSLDRAFDALEGRAGTRIHLGSPQVSRLPPRCVCAPSVMSRIVRCRRAGEWRRRSRASNRRRISSRPEK